MKIPYRIVVWGPGGIGNICIREILRKEEFELAGVKAYSESKHGQDIGTLLGLDPVGVEATTCADEILNLDCDAIIHTSQDLGGFLANDEILSILDAGKRLITVHPFQHLHAVAYTKCPPDFVEKIQASCEKSGAVFHSSGLHPEIVCHRITGALTGLCTDIKTLRVEENWDVSHVNGLQLQMVGFSQTIEEAKKNFAIANMSENYCQQNLYGMAALLGVTLDRVEVEHQHTPAPVDLTFAQLDVPKGTVGRLTHIWKGYVNAIGPEPFIIIENNWMMGRKEMMPTGTHPDHYYVVTVEGTPSLKMGLDIKASMKTGQQLVDLDDPASEPGYYGCAAVLLQSVPMVCAAEPGVLPVTQPQLHWMKDFRDLATND